MPSQRIPPGVRDAARRTISSHLLKDTMTYTNYSAETGGSFTEFTSTIRNGFNNPPHYHTLFSETFTCTKGTLSMTLDGKRLSLSPGQSATVEIGHVHSLINDSGEDADFITRLEPGNEGFEQAMYIMHGLANDGLTNKDGVPGNPMTLAMMVALMDTWLSGWAFWLAMPVLAGLRRTGQGLGIEARLLDKYWNTTT